MPQKGIGWSYTTIINGGRRGLCRTCGKTAYHKPIHCNNEGHIKAYSRRAIIYQELKLDSDKYTRRKEQTKTYQEENRLSVLYHYGGKCICCGFNDLNKKIRQGDSLKGYLQIDRIDGGDRAFIRKMKIGGGLYYWLKRNNYPKEYRDLCQACNAAMEPSETICELHKWQSNRFDNILNDLYKMES